MLPTRITLDDEGYVTVYLRDALDEHTVRSEAILDVNQAGRWIRGIELIGGIDFDLEKAVRPFNPTRPTMRQSGGVTYDEEANASFIYFSMKPQDPLKPETALEYSHSITPEAEWAFAHDGGLVSLRFSPQDANDNPADFVCLIDAPVEQVTRTKEDG